MMKNGRATFYVKATAPVQDVTLIVGSSDETQTAAWRHISFMEPPVPQVVFSCIFDRDGDGRGDSVFAKLSKPYGSTLVNNYVNLDSIQLEFGEKFPAITAAGGTIKHNDRDSTMMITTNGGFGTVPFTGGAENVYTGKITPFWKYTEGGSQSTISITGEVTDSIGPVITAATISYSDDGSTVLSLTFSEGLDCENEADANYFIYWPKQTNIERQDVVPDILSKDKKNKWKLIFRSARNDKEAYIPVMGDSIKMIPGIHMDLLHRSTPANNKYVRISGQQKVVITSSPVVTIGEKEESLEIIQSPTPTVPKLYQTPEPKTAKEVAEEYGVQGHYLGEMSISNYVKDEVTELKAAVKNINDKSVERTGLNIKDLIETKSYGDIKRELELSNDEINEIRDAISSGIVSKEDLIGIANGNTAIIEDVTKKLSEKTTLEYQTHYYSSLGVFVNSSSGTLSCTDDLYNGNCLDNEKNGKLFLAWNMRSTEGRLVGTGVYIARLMYKIKVGWKVKVNRTQDFLWGVRHGRTKGFEIDLNY
jgi:hypothetical protein